MKNLIPGYILATFGFYMENLCKCIIFLIRSDTWWYFSTLLEEKL